ncbi:hypothetical protein ORD21_09005 [Deinococcus sp. ZS9-10]|uniref:Uncharacterized protein n=2 Tax=Deinococcus arenicola TaxID=2994950 RepID=A0ABU4DQM0_9DEIO|nr:hypothetical protein [Deinococcus sp. ZS9-10]MDV6374724.1 hypothetical protein [Deinococcus sp. ZS9-10]
MEDAGQVAACGGVWLEKGGAGLAWGMVSRQQHRRGLGSVQLRIRLARLHELGVREVHLDTTQRSAPFALLFFLPVTVLMGFGGWWTATD